MTDTLSIFEIVNEVGESWDRVKRIPTWDELVGYTLFQKMFELAPDSWEVLPFSMEEFENKDEKFLVFARQFVRMLDLSVHMLGPDMEIVEEQLQDLGDMHARYGVTAQHYEIMGEGLELTLKTVLGKKSYYTETTRESWIYIYKFMTDAMLKGADA